MSYDSRQDTRDHICRVQDLIRVMITNLELRQRDHDQSKLQEPEKSIFDEFTPKLKSSTYGSEEYKGYLDAMKPGLDHHYAENSHHPEHFDYWECDLCFRQYPRGSEVNTCESCLGGQFTKREGFTSVNKMTLLDLIEMLADWKAAGERHANGSMEKSLEHNQVRFGITEQLSQILKNTARELGWIVQEADRCAS